MRSLLQELDPHVLYLVDFSCCQMRDARILSAGDQTKLQSWPRFLGPGFGLRQGEDGARGLVGWRTRGRNGQLLPTARGSRDRKGSPGKTPNPLLCFLAQHPQAWSSHRLPTAGEGGAMDGACFQDHGQHTGHRSGKHKPLADRTATPATAYSRVVTTFVSPGYCPRSNLTSKGRRTGSWAEPEMPVFHALAFLCLKVAVESGKSQAKGLGHYFQKML